MSGWRLLLALVLLFGGTLGHAQTFPKLTARFVDAANLLQPDQRAALESKLASLEQSTGHQVFVATIPDLQGYPLEDYGYKLLRAWAPGAKDKNDGLVVFLAPNEPPGHRGPRIEVGYGLEPLVTDAFASDVARNIMTPRLRAGDIAGALNAGVDAIGAQIRLTPEEAAKRATQASTRQAPTSQRGHGGSMIFWLLILFFVILPLLRGIGGRRYGGGGIGSGGIGGGGIGSTIGNVVLWSALNNLGSRSGGSSWGGGDDSGGGWGGGGSDFGGGGGGSGGGGGASGDW